MRKANKLIGSLVGIILVLFVLCIVNQRVEEKQAEVPVSWDNSEDTILVGLLFSDTGSSALVEKSMKNAAMLAFDEINAKGGVKGKKIQYISEDYSASPSLAGEKIRYLIEKEKVVATIGCYSSASRQATLPVLEKYRSLLIYPTYTEGEEQHPYVIYTGAMPNQQTAQFIPWLMEHLGKKVFLIGTDYIFPVTSNKQAKLLIEQQKGEICGELYAPAGALDFTEAIEEIKKADPDFIYCDLIGDSVVAFYKQYYKSGASMEDCPIASITTDEMTLKQMGAECSEGSYASMNYFASLDTKASREFVQKYQAYVQDDSMVTCLAEAVYDSCYLLYEALNKVDNPYDTEKLIEAFEGVEFDAPQGKIVVDQENHCTWLSSRFAKVVDGTYHIIYESPDLIQPDPWILSSH